MSVTHPVILAHNIFPFDQRQTKKQSVSQRGLPLVNHCSCMQIQANIFGIYPVPAFTHPKNTPHCSVANGEPV